MITARLAAFPLIFAALAAAWEPKVWEVTLGGAAPNQISFQPNTVCAEPGDIVRFFFKQKNHTVTQSSFAEVCQPLLDDYTYEPVFDSGFKPVSPETTDDFPYVDFPVSNKDPSWFYCRQTNHCGQGMVFAINAPTEGDKTFENFKKKALEFGQQSSTATQTDTMTDAGVHYSEPNPPAPATYYSETYSPAPAPTSTPESVTTRHRVIVGFNGTLSFSPPVVNAQPHDIIVFEFQTKNHTVTQSSFDAPCRKLEFTSNEKGFDSGFMPVANGTTTFPTFNVTVQDEKPIWVYCRQDKHCGQGMVFAVNAPAEPSEKSFNAFVALAKQLNGTSTNQSVSQSVNNNSPSGAVPTIRASMAFATFLVAGGLSVLTL